MEHARPLALDASGQAQMLHEDEVQYMMQSEVDIYNRSVKSELRRGTAILTSHRLCWIDPQRRAPIYWQLAMVQTNGVVTEEGGFFASAKIVLHFSCTEGAPCFIKLSFKAGGRDDMLVHLRKAMERKKWVAPLASLPAPAAGAAGAAAGEKRPRPVEEVVKTAGLAGLRHKAEQQAAEAKRETEAAFSDLNELEKHAKSMVTLIQRYSAEAARKAAAAAARDSPAGSPPADEDEISALVLNLGIISNPITKQNAGKLFHESVARQLAGFLAKPLERVGGMMTLVDVYCLYNRARATELISPEDTYEAAKLLLPLRLGMSLRAFPSGLRVIQLDSFSDEAVGERVKRELTAMASASAGSEPYVTALDLSTKWRIPLQVAQQQLLIAESRGNVCRDDSINGLRFYRNLFAEL